MTSAQGPQPPQPWAPLPAGRFSGVDWSQPGSMAQADPYLAWAETSGFANYRLPQRPSHNPEWLAVLIELSPDHCVNDLLRCGTKAWLQIPKVYQHWAPSLRFCTARVKRGFFDALAPGGALEGMVQRYELGLPLDPGAQALAADAVATDTDGDNANTVAQRVSGPVMVLIDNGLAVGHADFLQGENKTRVAAFWRQDATQGPHGRSAASTHAVPLDPSRAGPTPSDMGYGHELKFSHIQAAIERHTAGRRLDEDGLYQHLQMWDLNHAVQHGTHVASLAAGPRIYTDTIGTEDSPPNWAPAEDIASKASLIVVQLAWDSVADSSGGAQNVSVFEALAFALARCAKDAEVVVNLSWGALAGSHNGSSMIEAGMAHLIDRCGISCELVVPAGNAYQARTHANACLEAGASATLHWRVQPDDHTQSFLETWFEAKDNASAKVQGIEIELTPPGATQPLAPLGAGDSGVWPSAQSPQCGLLFAQPSALGTPGACAVLALAPTASWYTDAVRSNPGVWTIKITNRGSQPVVMDAYVERDDVPLGVAHTGARQSCLEDRWYDTEGGIDGFIDQPGSATLIRRSGTFNDLASGSQTVSVGGIRYFASASDPMARYSPRLPDPDQSRTERCRVKKVPDRLAVSDDHATLWGVRAAGTRSASAVRLVGTSMAAPQVARDRLNVGGGLAAKVTPS